MGEGSTGQVSKCCFCEGGEWGKAAHLGCFVKASGRGELVTNDTKRVVASRREVLVKKISRAVDSINRWEDELEAIPRGVVTGVPHRRVVIARADSS